MTSPISAVGVRAIERTGVERARLVRRTYALVFASVLVTMGGAAFGLSEPRLMRAVTLHPFIALVAMLAPMLVVTRARPAFPLDIALTFLFTFVAGVVLAPLLSLSEARSPGIAVQAGALTGTAFGVLTLYAFVSRRDFSAWRSFFSVGLWVLAGTAVLNIFFANRTADLWIASASVLVFSGLLVFDTWRLRNEYAPEEYAQAAVRLYVDLLNIFVATLSLLGGRRD
jgi:FtsH-binding integral membrane protein